MPPGQAVAQRAAPLHRVRPVEHNPRRHIIVGREARGLAVTQLPQIRQLALHDLFVRRTQQLLFQAREVAADAVARLAELNVITRAHGRPYLPVFNGAALHETLPDLWYEGWHP